MSLFSWLAVIFITLKILAIPPVAGWSWWLVTVPLWGGIMIIFLFLTVDGIIEETIHKRRK